MYVLADLPNNRVLGFVKTGEKKLFLHDNLGRMKEVTPTCVLDFYVHESCQRQGCGRKLFDAFVKAEQVRYPNIGWAPFSCEQLHPQFYLFPLICSRRMPYVSP